MAYGSVNVPGARMATLGTDGKLEGAQRPSLAEIQGGSGRNLIINGDLRNPVNRNSLTQYQKGVNLDRWICDGEVTLNDGYITVGNNFYQIIPEQEASQYLGKQVTLSVLYHNGTLESGTITFPSAFPAETQGINVPGTTNLAIALYANKRIQIFRLNGGPHEVVAVKTELGPIQTLAHKEGDTWILNDPPDYAMQYALCSQYSPITGEFVGSQQSNPNLLDNARWDKNAYIINQMGYTKWTSDPKPETGADANTKYSYNAGKYSIDRWILQRVHTAELVANGFKLTCQPANANLMILEQKIENLDLSSPYTISVLISDIDGPANVWRVRGCAGPNYTIPTAPGLYSYTVTNPAGGDIYFWRIPTEEECSITISAVKIERGYVQTLAHKEGDTWVLNDPPPNKALELAKCQRYQNNLVPACDKGFGCIGTCIAIGTDKVNVFAPVSTALRAIPTIVTTGKFVVRSTSSATNGVVVTEFEACNLSSNGVAFNALVSGGLTAGAVYQLWYVPIEGETNMFLLDANL